MVLSFFQHGAAFGAAFRFFGFLVIEAPLLEAAGGINLEKSSVAAATVGDAVAGEEGHRAHGGKGDAIGGDAERAEFAAILDETIGKAQAEVFLKIVLSDPSGRGPLADGLLEGFRPAERGVYADGVGLADQFVEPQ